MYIRFYSSTTELTFCFVWDQIRGRISTSKAFNSSSRYLILSLSIRFPWSNCIEKCIIYIRWVSCCIWCSNVPFNGTKDIFLAKDLLWAVKMHVSYAQYYHWIQSEIRRSWGASVFAGYQAAKNDFLFERVLLLHFTIVSMWIFSTLSSKLLVDWN